MPLVPCRRAALGVAVVGAAVAVSLGVLVHGSHQGTSFDGAVVRVIIEHMSYPWRRHAADIANPMLVLSSLVVIALVALARRRYDVVALTVIAPSCSVLLTERVLKPVVGRYKGGGLAWPSGHETGLASVVLVLMVVLLGSGLSGRIKVAGGVVAAVVLVVGAVGLVGVFYHYATDTIGAVAVTAVVTATVALVIDSVAARHAHRANDPVVRVSRR